LFYSYCHIDEDIRDEMEKGLSVLRRNGLISEWHDRKIVTGEKWSPKIRKELESSDIVIFIVTPDFLDSDACIEEWDHAKSLEKINLATVIARDCPWTDFDDMAEFQALPKDGKAISLWENRDTAWKNVYSGIKTLVEEVQSAFVLDSNFKRSITDIEFCSQTKDAPSLEDVFVFPPLYTHLRFADEEKQIANADQLLDYPLALIRGENQSGKSKLCAHVFLHLVENSRPVLFVDLEEIKSKSPKLEVFEQKYREQFSGDFNLWLKQKDSTVILDNLTHGRHSLKHISLARKYFSRVIVTTSTDSFSAFFKDEVSLGKFSNFRIGHFGHSKQEQLIKKWLSLSSDKSNSSQELEYSRIDRIERDVNSVLINNKIVPRYPFYILSVLQTHELFMPRDLKITSYGHCYYALIIAHLIKSGIDPTDENINPCFNFARNLAYRIYLGQSKEQTISASEYADFLVKYNEKYIIRQSLVNKLFSSTGILDKNDGATVGFRVPYSYYFFLGSYLAQNYDANQELLSRMMEMNYVRENTMALTFAIHHASDSKLLDDILTHTACIVDQFEPAKLNETETQVFNELLETIPKKILSDRSIEEERAIERDKMDQKEVAESTNEPEDNNSPTVNDVYVSQKNIEILSQILKNKAGILEKDKIEEIVQIICDAGLRLISIFLCDEEELQELTEFIEEKYSGLVGFKRTHDYDKDIRGLSKVVRLTIFIWTMNNIEKIVTAVSKPELRGIIQNIRDRNETPAFDVIHYFYSLDVSDSFGEDEKRHLQALLEKYDSKDLSFLQRILSLRTQHYINTHKIRAPLKQSVKSLLEIEDKSSSRSKGK
jgi:TIR domain-containing protein